MDKRLAILPLDYHLYQTGNIKGVVDPPILLNQSINH